MKTRPWNHLPLTHLPIRAHDIQHLAMLPIPACHLPTNETPPVFLLMWLVCVQHLGVYHPPTHAAHSYLPFSPKRHHLAFCRWLGWRVCEAMATITHLVMLAVLPMLHMLPKLPMLPVIFPYPSSFQGRESPFCNRPRFPQNMENSTFRKQRMLLVLLHG